MLLHSFNTHDAWLSSNFVRVDIFCLDSVEKYYLVKFRISCCNLFLNMEALLKCHIISDIGECQKSLSFAKSHSRKNISDNTCYADKLKFM